VEDKLSNVHLKLITKVKDIITYLLISSEELKKEFNSKSFASWKKEFY